MNEAAIMDDGGADAGQEGIGSIGGLGLRKDDDNGVVVSRTLDFFIVCILSISSYSLL